MIPTIGLCMIVKDESAVIVRCLESVRPIVDYVLIVDTGSSDGTVAIVERYLAERGLAGEVIRCAWVDFAYNRTFALERLRERREIDYGLMIDADEVLRYAPDFDPKAFKAGLDQDLYDIISAIGEYRYPRPQLFRNRLPFRFEGVLHEYLVRPDEATGRATAQGLWNLPSPDGARSRNPHKFEDDAAVLRKALAGELEPWLRARYQFYLAQSLRDAGRAAEAVDAYRKRATMGGNIEEVFYSHYQAARLGEQLERPWVEVLAAYMEAFEAAPERGEALHGAARWCRRHGRHHLAYELSGLGLKRPQPSWGFCIEPWIYDYGLLDEHAVSAYWAGDYAASLQACDRLLASPRLPPGERPRIETNRGFAVDRLAEIAAG